MRNLKKILALVLALVMSLSLMATAGASSFSDVEAGNQYETAIDVLDALKVFIGYGDGTFQPTGELTRAEAAVLVYRIATGDVEGKYVANYTDMAQSKFNDLTGYEWARGYINYCQNAEIVVGTSATTFSPGSKVTGYQLMVMVLRTLGYGKAGEFSNPSSWELETAKIAEREGMLKNVTTGDFGAPAQRQMVAEILFQGLLQETVQYSALTPGGYTKTGVTLGKQELNLEEVRGVVVANEYASLTSNSPKGEGKTDLVMDDNTHTIDWTTTLDDIGESRLVYTQGSKVLSLADNGNTTEVSTDAESLKDVLSRAGIANGGEKFLNFAQLKGYQTNNNIRIKYVLDYDYSASLYTLLVANHANHDGVVCSDCTITIRQTSDDKVVTAADAAAGVETDYYIAVEHVFRPKFDISIAELGIIERIFAGADTDYSKDEADRKYISGEVYVGTQSYKDISDTMSYDDFVDAYLKTSDVLYDYDKNENGNWLKVIDNDGNGVADYVLKVVYTGAQVERVKDDKVTLDVKDHALAPLSHDRIGADSAAEAALNTLTDEAVVTMTDGALEEGDVVYYAIIDGVARAYKADTITATIDKINRNTKSTTTTDGDEYFESGVCNHIMDGEFKDEVTDLTGGVKFDLYFDRGGHLLTFIKSNITGDFKLITDGWFNSTKTADEYAVRVYNDDEDKQEIVDLTSGGPAFISRSVRNSTGYTVQNNDWGALKYLGGIDESTGALNNNVAHDTHGTAADPISVPAAALNGFAQWCEGAGNHSNLNAIKTTVASVSEDGVILPVENYAITGRYDHRMIDVNNNVIPTSAYTAGVAYTTSGNTAYDTNDGAVELRALSTTKYYVVWPNSDHESVGVKAFTGYSSVSDIKSLVTARDGSSLIEDVYAVGTETQKDNTRGTVYFTADIVVIELYATPTNARSIVLLVDDEGQVDNTGKRRVEIIDADGHSKWVEIAGGGYSTGDLLARNNYEKKLAPGLYYISETSTEGLYTGLTALTEDEIRDAGCFVTGQVQYYSGTVRNDFVVVNPFYWGEDEFGDAALYYGYDYGTKEPVITENSKFYELGYGFTDIEDYRENGANLSDEDALTYRDVVEGRVEGTTGDRTAVNSRTDEYYDTTDGQTYFYNDVLIRTNNKNEIVYAVSFQNTYNKTGDRDVDFAQLVWEAVIPAIDVEEDTVQDWINGAKKMFVETTAPYETVKPGVTVEMLEYYLHYLQQMVINPDISVAEQTELAALIAGIEKALEDIEIAAAKEAAKQDVRDYAELVKGSITAEEPEKSLIEAAIDAEVENAVKDNGTIDNATGADKDAIIAAIGTAKQNAMDAIDAAAAADVTGDNLIAGFTGADLKNNDDTDADEGDVDDATDYKGVFPEGTVPTDGKLSFSFKALKTLQVSAQSDDARIDTLVVDNGDAEAAGLLAASDYRTVTVTVTLTNQAAFAAKDGLTSVLEVTFQVNTPEVPNPEQSTVTDDNPIDTTTGVAPVDPVNTSNIEVAPSSDPSETGVKDYDLTAKEGTVLTQTEDGDSIVQTYMTVAEGYKIESDPEKGITAEPVETQAQAELNGVLWMITVNVTRYNATAEVAIAVEGNVLADALTVTVTVSVDDGALEAAIADAVAEIETLVAAYGDDREQSNADYTAAMADLEAAEKISDIPALQRAVVIALAEDLTATEAQVTASLSDIATTIMPCLAVKDGGVTIKADTVNKVFYVVGEATGIDKATATEEQKAALVAWNNLSDADEPSYDDIKDSVLFPGDASKIIIVILASGDLDGDDTLVMFWNLNDTDCGGEIAMGNYSNVTGELAYFADWTIDLADFTFA